jgi:Mrp family chromosome partitioning ATPase
MNMLRSEETALLLERDRRVPPPSEVNLAATILDQNCRLLLLTAPTSGSGTTLSAMSLAGHLAQASNGRILLLDANPSASGLSSLLGMAGAPGLFELLLSDAPEEMLEECVQRHPDHSFDLLPLGQRSLTASRFTAEEIQDLLAMLSEHYRFVVIDAEAVYSGSSAASLAAMVDGVILVIRAEVTRREVAQAAVERLRQANARLLGSVFNGRKYYMPQWLYNLL